MHGLARDLSQAKNAKDVAKVAIFGSTVARAFTIDCMTVKYA